MDEMTWIWIIIAFLFIHTFRINNLRKDLIELKEYQKKIIDVLYESGIYLK